MAWVKTLALVYHGFHWLAAIWGVWNGACSEHILAPTGSADWSELKDQIAIWWAWCYTPLSPSLPSNWEQTVRQWVGRLWTVSHLFTRRGHQRTEHSLYAKTQLTKTEQVNQPACQKHLQWKQLSHAFTQYNNLAFELQDLLSLKSIIVATIHLYSGHL